MSACVCLVADAPVASLNVMNFVILNSKRDKCFLNIVAGVCWPDKENTTEERKQNYIRQQTKSYGILPLTMQYQMVGLTTQPLS